MPRRHPIPTIWLMTDERMGVALWDVLERLPRGAGVVFRHYASDDRARLLARVEAIAGARGLVVVAAGLKASGGCHGGRRGRGLLTRSAHSRADIVAAMRAGADAIFVSPVFATRSHPGARGLGVARLGLMIRGLQAPVIALGGMDTRKARTLKPMGIYGWAGIDAFAPRQKRKAVPT